jgi:hypothetical protein
MMAMDGQVSLAPQTDEERPVSYAVLVIQMTMLFIYNGLAQLFANHSQTPL